MSPSLHFVANLTTPAWTRPGPCRVTSDVRRASGCARAGVLILSEFAGRGAVAGGGRHPGQPLEHHRHGGRHRGRAHHVRPGAAPPPPPPGPALSPSTLPVCARKRGALTLLQASVHLGRVSSQTCWWPTGGVSAAGAAGAAPAELHAHHHSHQPDLGRHLHLRAQRHARRAELRTKHIPPQVPPARPAQRARPLPCPHHARSLHSQAMTCAEPGTPRRAAPEAEGGCSQRLGLPRRA